LERQRDRLDISKTLSGHIVLSSPTTLKEASGLVGKTGYKSQERTLAK
jgi:hypothetical protein